MVGEFTSATFYDHVRVPATNLVGQENGGWPIITNQLNLERVAISPVSGILRSIQEARAWAAAHRLADGRRVIDQEWVRVALARLWARAEALKLFNWKVAWAADKGLQPADASATKVYGSEFALECYRALSEVVGQSACISSKGPTVLCSGAGSSARPGRRRSSPSEAARTKSSATSSPGSAWASPAPRALAVRSGHDTNDVAAREPDRRRHPGGNRAGSVIRTTSCSWFDV